MLTIRIKGHAEHSILRKEFFQSCLTNIQIRSRPSLIASSCSKPFIQITVRYNKGMLSVLRLDCYFLPWLNKAFYCFGQQHNLSLFKGRRVNRQV